MSNIYHANGNTAYRASDGYAFHENGKTAYRASDGYTFYENGNTASRGDFGIEIQTGPGIRIFVGDKTFRLYIYGNCVVSE